MPERLFLEDNCIRKLIGKKGKIKRLLEKELGIKLIIKKTGEVSIKGDPLKTFTTLKVIEAINLGFPIDDALLIKEDIILEVIDLKHYAKNKSRLREIKSRVIGRDGKVKKVLENLSGVLICIGDKELGIIGKLEIMVNIKSAIENLLKGSPHAKVFKMIESTRFSNEKPENYVKTH